MGELLENNPIDPQTHLCYSYVLGDRGNEGIQRPS